MAQWERVLNKFQFLQTCDGSDSEEQDSGQSHEVELEPLLKSREANTNPFGSSLFFSNVANQGKKIIKHNEASSSSELADHSSRFRKRRADTIYAFEINIDTPQTKHIHHRSATANLCQHIDVDVPTLSSVYNNSSWVSGAHLNGKPKCDKGYRTTLPIDPALISNFDYVIPVKGMKNIDINSPYSGTVSPELVTEVLMRIFIGRVVRSGTTRIECDDASTIDPIYGLEPFIHKRMTEPTLRKVILNRFLHIICNIMESDLIRLADDEDTELWCIALSDKGAKKIAHRLGYFLKMSRDACTATGRFTEVMPEDRPMTAFDDRYEKYLESQRVANGGRRMLYLWERYNRLGEVVEVKTAAGLKDPELSMFTPVQRLQLIDLFLCDYLDLDEFSEIISHGEKPYPLHQPILQERLRVECASFKHVWWPTVGINNLRNYFGEEIGMYFAFLSHYTYSLIIPSCAGFVMMVLQRILDPDLLFHSKPIAYMRAAYAMFIAIWVNFMVYTWRIKQRRLEVLWGGDQGQKEFRVNRIANLKFHFDYWVEDDRLPTRFNKTYSKRKSQARHFLSRTIGVVLILCVGLLTNPDLHELFFKYYGILDDLTGYFKQIPLLDMIGFEFESTVTSITILLLHKAFASLSVALAKLENHKYLETYNQSIIKKFASFSGLDYLGPFLYLAFIKRYFFNVYGEKKMNEDKYLWLLMAQLRNLFIVGMFSNVFELGMPFAKRWLSDRVLAMNRMKQHHTHRRQKTQDPASLERRLPEYESTLDDYIEVITQLALVGSFAVAWTPVALLACISNLVELRVDLIKLVSFFRRPRPTPAVSIDAWNTVLNAISSLSIVLSNLMVAFVLVPQAKIVTKIFYVLLSTILCFFVKYTCFASRNDKWSELTIRKRSAILQEIMAHL